MHRIYLLILENKICTMKNLRIFSLLLMVIGLAFTSCKNDGSAKKDAARESLTANASSNAKTKPATPKTPEVPVGPLTSIKFEESSYDYGEIMDGDVVEHVYKFKNTGKEPLVISKAKGSCGCTIPDWPREPIPVGGTGEIKVKFNSRGKGRVGGANQSKRVTITANTDPAQTYLTIKGKVNKKEDAKKK